MSQDALEAMLAAWRQWIATGSPVARDVALEMADRNRTTAKEAGSAR